LIEIICKFFEYQTSHNKLNDIISSVLQTKDSDTKLLDIIHQIVVRLPNSSWFVQSMLPVIISNVANNNENAEKLLSRAFKDDKLSTLLFNTVTTIDKELQLTPIKVTVECILSMDKEHLVKVLSMLESQWRVSHSTKIWNELHQLLTIYSTTTPLQLFIESSLCKLLDHLVTENSAESESTLRSIINVFLNEFMSKTYSKLVLSLINFLSKENTSNIHKCGHFYLRDLLSSLHLLDLTYVPVHHYTKCLLNFSSEIKKQTEGSDHKMSLDRLLLILQQLNDLLIASTSPTNKYLLLLLQDSFVLNSLVKLCKSQDEGVRYYTICIFSSFYAPSSAIPSEFWTEVNVKCILSRIEDKNRKTIQLASQLVQNIIKERSNVVPLILKTILQLLLDSSNMNSPSIGEFKKLLTIILTNHGQYAELAVTILKSKIFGNR
jgi:hypothetical protein